MKAIVTANEGYVSGQMRYEDAVIYAAALEGVGNYNVSVVIVSENCGSWNVAEPKRNYQRQQAKQV